jgi:hypothetical protein
MSAETLGNGLGYLVVGEIDMAAASFAHGGRGRLGHLQFGATLETTDVPLFDCSRNRRRRRAQRLLNSEMFPALLANARVRSPRLRLDMPALRAGDRDRILVW